MTVVSAYGTHAGRERHHNEDYVWCDDAAGVYVVADGMGGHEAGEVAARLAAERVGTTLVAATAGDGFADRMPEVLDRAVQMASALVRTAGQAANQHRRMGCALVGLVVRPPRAHVVHAGDCRAYLVRAGQLIRLTNDHTVLAELIAAGEVTDLSRPDPRRNTLTAVLGQATQLPCTGRDVDVVPEDWLLLCSDGLWDMVGDDVTLALLAEAEGDPARACRHLIEAANVAGGKDNISVVAVRITADDVRTSEPPG